MSGRKPGGPVHSGHRVLRTPHFEVTFDQDLTDDEVQEFVARFQAARRTGRHQVFEPIPDFAECGRPGCDLREKRLEHGHFGDRPKPYLIEPIHRPDPWGIWPLVLILAVVAAVVGLAVEVWR